MFVIRNQIIGQNIEEISVSNEKGFQIIFLSYGAMIKRLDKFITNASKITNFKYLFCLVFIQLINMGDQKK